MSILKPKADIESMQGSARADKQAEVDFENYLEQAKPTEENQKQDDETVANPLSVKSANSKNLMINIDDVNSSQQNSSRNMIYFNGRSAAGSGKNINEQDYEDGMFKGL